MSNYKGDHNKGISNTHTINVTFPFEGTICDMTCISTKLKIKYKNRTNTDLANLVDPFFYPKTI